jgi:two-component SAPR family response regulator
MKQVKKVQQTPETKRKTTNYNRSIILISDHVQGNEINTLLQTITTNESIVIKNSVWASLYFIQENYTSTGAIPQLIILNMKMPELTGADFLEAFQYLPMAIRSNCEIIVYNAGECEKTFNYVMQFPMVLHYHTGPITKESTAKIFASLLRKYNERM